MNIQDNDIIKVLEDNRDAIIKIEQVFKSNDINLCKTLFDKLIVFKNNSHVQNILGDMYYFGYGTPIDQKEAFKWYALSADQGNAEGQNSLGNLYHLGYGVDQNYCEAFKLYKLSAEQGMRCHKTILGFCIIMDMVQQRIVKKHLNG